MTSLDPHTSPEHTPVCGEEAGSVPVIAGWVAVPSRDRMTAPICHVKQGSPSKDGSWERWYLRWVLFLHTLSYPCGNLKCQGSWGGGPEWNLLRVQFQRRHVPLVIGGQPCAPVRPSQERNHGENCRELVTAMGLEQ